MLHRQRVRDTNRRPPEIARGQPQPPRKARVGEAQCDHGVEAEVAHHVFRAATQRLLAGQSATLASRLRQGGREVLVVAVDPPHLLHQVGLATDVVVAMAGNLGRQVVALALDPEPKPLQVGGAELRLDPHPEQRIRTVRAQPHPAHGGHLRGGVDRPGHEPRSAQLHDQL